jgi:hypothetical protein
MAKVRAPPGLRRETRNDGMLSFRSGRATRYGPSILTFTPAPGACPPTNAGSRWSWHGARLWLAERTETGTRSVSAFVDGHARVGDRCYSVSCQRHEEEDGLAVDPAGWCLGYLESLRAKP